MSNEGTTKSSSALEITFGNELKNIINRDGYYHFIIFGEEEKKTGINSYLSISTSRSVPTFLIICTSWL